MGFVTKWERLEPLQHRPPMPEVVVRAMCSVAASWVWREWAFTTLLCFCCIARIGEVLGAKRGDLLTALDAMEPGCRLYLVIRSPKTRHRGARVQHAEAKGPDWILEALSGFFPKLPLEQPLYGALLEFTGTEGTRSWLPWAFRATCG